MALATLNQRASTLNTLKNQTRDIIECLWNKGHDLFATQFGTEIGPIAIRGILSSSCLSLWDGLGLCST